jgi:hypothetical protein
VNSTHTYAWVTVRIAVTRHRQNGSILPDPEIIPEPVPYRVTVTVVTLVMIKSGSNIAADG